MRFVVFQGEGLTYIRIYVIFYSKVDMKNGITQKLLTMNVLNNLFQLYIDVSKYSKTNHFILPSSIMVALANCETPKFIFSIFNII